MPQLVSELKALIASSINLGGIDVSRYGENDALFGRDGMGLDSIDAMELVLLLQKTYGISFEDIAQARQVFQSLGTLAQYVQEHRLH